MRIKDTQENPVGVKLGAVTSRWVDNVIVVTSYNNDNSDSNNE